MGHGREQLQLHHAHQPGQVRLPRQVVLHESEIEQKTPSAWSGLYHFTVDKTAPVGLGISSTDYPTNAWGKSQGQEGTLSLVTDDSTAQDTAGFTYAIDTATPPDPSNIVCDYTTAAAGASSGYLEANSAGDAILTIPANDLAPGYHQVTVGAFDHAHNVTPTFKTYGFFVSPTYADADGEAIGNTVYDFSTSSTSELGLVDATTAGASTGDNLHRDASCYSDDTYGISSGGKFHRIVATRGDLTAPVRSTYKFTVPTNYPDFYYSLGVAMLKGNHLGKVRFALAEQPTTAPDGTPIKTELDPITFRTTNGGDPSSSTPTPRPTPTTTCRSATTSLTHRAYASKQAAATS